MYKYLIYISCILLSGCHQSEYKHKFARILTLPTFRILSADSSVCVNTSFFPNGQSRMFIYFGTDCEHCQAQISTLLDNIGKFKNTKIYLITEDSFDDIKKFSDRNKLEGRNDIFVGKDFNFSFYSLFVPPAVPFIAIYN